MLLAVRGCTNLCHWQCMVRAAPLLLLSPPSMPEAFLGVAGPCPPASWLWGALLSSAVTVTAPSGSKGTCPDPSVSSTMLVTSSAVTSPPNLPYSNPEPQGEGRVTLCLSPLLVPRASGIEDQPGWSWRCLQNPEQSPGGPDGFPRPCEPTWAPFQAW